jgi:hypothetical protein
MTNLKINKKAVIHYILIYLFIVFHGATIYVLNKGYMQLVIELVCVFMWIKNKRIRKKGVLILLSVLFLLTLTVSLAAGSGTGLTFFRHVADEIIITYTVIFYDKNFFLKRFFKILSIFAVASLIFFTILIINPNILFRILTKRAENITHIHYGVILYSISQISGRTGLRNCGIFMEPGIYAVLLISAVYALLFFNVYLNISTKQRYTYFIIFTLTILSTLSTIAYVVSGILVIGYIFKSERASQFIKEKRKLVFLCLIIVIMLLVNYYKQGDNSILSIFVLSKADSTALLTEESSGNARVVTIQTCLAIIKKYPFGAGGNFVRDSLPNYAVAAQFLVYTASMGLINAGILYLYFLVPAFKNRPSLIAFIIFLPMYIMLSLAQSEVWYPSLLMFPVMWQSYRRINNRVKFV